MNLLLAIEFTSPPPPKKTKKKQKKNKQTKKQTLGPSAMMHVSYYLLYNCHNTMQATFGNKNYTK